MKRIPFALFILAWSLSSAGAATLSKTYTYFAIGGMTLTEIERQLQTLGPRLNSTGQRHPGATNMQMSMHVDYAQTRGRCRVAVAKVSVNARVTLPRWRNRQRAEQEVRLVWDTLARDIKRHEESHMSIAKSHARQLEDALKALPWRKSCRALAADVEAATARILAEHDAAQDAFDRVENINFERRIMRLLRYRLQQMEAGRLR